MPEIKKLFINQSRDKLKNSLSGVWIPLLFISVGVLLSEVAMAQSTNFTPVPTWTDDQWENADKESRGNEEELETNQKISEGKLTPLPMTKDFSGVIILNPPDKFKILTSNGKAYLTWNKVDKAMGYCVYDSKDGKTFKKRFHPVKETKIFVGFITWIKNHPKHYYGFKTISWGGESEMVVQSVGPQDFAAQ